MSSRWCAAEGGGGAPTHRSRASRSKWGLGLPRSYGCLRQRYGCSRIDPTVTRRLPLLVFAALGVAGAASARTAATADLSIKWFGVNPLRPLAGSIFTLAASTVNAGPDASHARINIDMPAGVRKVASELACTQDGQTLHCDEFDAPVGDDGSGRASFVADTPGSYTFVVYLDHLSVTDPNLADNRDSITVTVPERPIGAGSLSIRPASPQAGKPFVASFPLTGAAVDSVRCTTSIGKAAPRQSPQRASCAVNTPRSARGRVLRGSVTAIVGTHTFVRRYTVRLR